MRPRPGLRCRGVVPEDIVAARQRGFAREERAGANPIAGRVARLQITRTAEEKFWARRIDRDQVAAVPEGRTVLARNRKGRAASHLLIGRDSQGRCLAIPVNPTDDPSVWRVITAWYCKPSEAAKLR